MQARLYRILERGEGGPGRLANGVVFLIILGAGVFAIAETEIVLRREGDVPAWVPRINLALTVLFTAEWSLRLLAAGADPRFAGFRGRFRFLRRPLVSLDTILVVICLSQAALVDFYLLRLLRLGRLLIILRLTRFTDAGSLLLDTLKSRVPELAISLLIAVGLLLTSAIILYSLEGTIQPEAFGSIPRALWWAVTTLTTVGYGDHVPQTGAGRLVASIAAILAIGVIALPTGIVAASFSDSLEKWRRRKLEQGPDEAD